MSALAQVSDAQLAEVALTRGEYELASRLLGRAPAEVELGVIGAMWSEHCGYKTSKPLLARLPTSGARVLQGPGENAGAVDIGGVGLCDLANDFSSGGIDGGEGFPGCAIHPLIIDEQFGR